VRDISRETLGVLCCQISPKRVMRVKFMRVGFETREGGVRDISCGEPGASEILRETLGLSYESLLRLTHIS